MSLFQTFIPRDEKYSNTIELYDAVPKYFPVKKLSEIRINDIYLPVVTREFHHKGKAYQVEIRPARITYDFCTGRASRHNKNEGKGSEVSARFDHSGGPVRPRRRIVYVRACPLAAVVRGWWLAHWPLTPLRSLDGLQVMVDPRRCSHWSRP